MNLSDLDRLDATIDRRLNNLGIFKLSLENALIYLLRNFEDRCRLPLISNSPRKEVDLYKTSQITHHLARESMDALSILLPRIYLRCKSTNRISRKCKENKYGQTGKALEIAYAYSQIKDAIHLCRIGVYKAKKTGENIYFLPSKNSINYDAQAQIISFGLVDKEATSISMQYPRPSKDLSSLFYKYIGNTGISKLISVTKSNSFLHHIPTDISDELTKIVQHILKHKWTIDNSIQFGQYSVGEAKIIWASLLKVSIFHHIACLFSGLPGIGLEYLPIIIKKQDLIDWLYSDSFISKQKISKIIADLIFNHRILTDEIMFQPLLPLCDDKILLIAPNILIFSNPERNLMKLWARTYSGIYGAKISAKGKEEERIIADNLKRTNKNFFVINSKELKKGKQIITDIDVAVYDRSNLELLFIQVKSFLKPDSPSEVRSADNKLNKGIDQLHKILKYINNKPNALEKIFNFKIPKLKSILMCVISSSNTGSFWVKKDFNIFNQEIVINSLKDSSQTSLSNLYQKWILLHSFNPRVDFQSIFYILRYNGKKYLLPATEIINDNALKKIIKYPIYFLFEIVLGGRYYFWPKRENPNIFAKDE